MLDWPDIPYDPWRETCSALHLFAQIVGKYRLARTPWLCHSWHATLYPTAAGLTTGPVPDRDGFIEIVFDFAEHAVIGRSSAGPGSGFPLQAMSVAAFDRDLRDLVVKLGGTAEWHGTPNELADPVPFVLDVARRPYDKDAVNRYFRALTAVTMVFSHFRTAFVGKASPVHLFWGSFDLAVTRFSGRGAPLHPGGIPFLPDAVTREAYSDELSSAGFWPGGAGVGFPAFYSYAYPEPPGFASARVEPTAAYYDHRLREYLLPYDHVRHSPDPAAELMRFLHTSFRAAADLGRWNKQVLECEYGLQAQPRRITANT